MAKYLSHMWKPRLNSLYKKILVTSTYKHNTCYRENNNHRIILWKKQKTKNKTQMEVGGCTRVNNSPEWIGDCYSHLRIASSRPYSCPWLTDAFRPFLGPKTYPVKPSYVYNNFKTSLYMVFDCQPKAIFLTQAHLCRRSNSCLGPGSRDTRL